MFQEWFEIQFETCDNPFEVFDSYYLKNIQKLKVKLKINDKENPIENNNIPEGCNNNLSNEVSLLFIY